MKLSGLIRAKKGEKKKDPRPPASVTLSNPKHIRSPSGRHLTALSTPNGEVPIYEVSDHVHRCILIS